MFDENETTVAGTARWGELSVAGPMESDEGEALLEYGWEVTEDEFQRNLNRGEEVLDDLSDEASMRNEDLARHAFHQVGAYNGPSVFL